MRDQGGRGRRCSRNSSPFSTGPGREFLDPLFKVLGWDLDNEQGYAEAYKDVIHEDAIRVGGTCKFFLEAKKPSVDIGLFQDV